MLSLAALGLTLPHLPPCLRGDRKRVKISAITGQDNECMILTHIQGGRCKRVQPLRVDSGSPGEYFKMGYLGSQMSP